MSDTHTQCDKCRQSALTSEGRYIVISPRAMGGMGGIPGRNDENMPERFFCRQCFHKYERGTRMVWYLLGFFFLVFIILMLVKKLYTLGVF